MKAFINFSDREIKRLQSEARTLRKQGHESEATAKLDLIEEIELAVIIIQNALTHAIHFNYIGALK